MGHHFLTLVRWFWLCSIFALVATFGVGTEMRRASQSVEQMQQAGSQRETGASFRADRHERGPASENMDLAVEEEDDDGDDHATSATELQPCRTSSPSRDRVEAPPARPEAPGHQRRTERPPRA
jgi:hypothetical protein